MKPKIGVSSCLLGQRVRFDGDHKRQDWLVDELGKWVTWYAVCPEMEMGLGAPRESLRLVRSSADDDLHLVTNATEKDLTVSARRTAARLVARLPELDGFILKKSSPSCGLERVKVYNRQGIPERTGIGIFAARLLESHPGLPVIEEGRLTDPEQREHFVTRVFALHRLRHTAATIRALQKFHEHYKLLLMAHSPLHYRQLGRIAANSARLPAEEVWEAYRDGFLDALTRTSTTRKRVNVLQHVFGYFSDQLSKRERHSILKTIEAYRQGEASFLAALTLVQHEMDRLAVPYLESQLFFQPYPRELKLRRYL